MSTSMSLSRRSALAGALVTASALAAPLHPREAAASRSSARGGAEQRAFAQLTATAARASRAGAILAVSGCGVAYLGASGVAERRSCRPMPVDAPVRAGSVTKLAVAAAVLDLARTGQLDLDAPARALLPAGTLDGIGGAEATVRQLLAHRGGVPDYYTEANIRTWDWRQPLTPARALEGVRGLPATHAPGASWVYSNTGYMILGLIAERAAGQPLGALLETRVLAPAGMVSSAYHLTHPGGPIHGYGTPDDPNADTWAYAENTGPDSGMTASVSDLQRLVSALFLPGGALEAIGRTMIADPAPTGRERRLSGLGPEIAIGRDGTRLVGHTGDVAGYLTFAYAAPAEGATLVGHINADRPEALAALLRGTVEQLRARCR